MYCGSEQHKQNWKAAGRIGNKVIQEKKKRRIAEYNKNPKECKYCNSSFEYENRHKIFCNSRCAALFNNKNRNYKHTTETREKISNKLKGIKRTTEQKCKLRGFRNGNWSGGLRLNDVADKKSRLPKKTKVQNPKIKITTCKICKEQFIQLSHGIIKTCSRECQIKASTNRTYQNGSRRTIYFDNPIQGKVVLESSWELEVAELLVTKNIKWLRPEPIKWVDTNFKIHLYYPDFYLIEQNIYLDPKNPYCMKRDHEKMKNIATQVEIKYGNLEKIKNYINTISTS